MTANETIWPPLPLAEWSPTRDTLQRFVQVAGKIRMVSHPPLNHWWHVPLYLAPRGITTRLLERDGVYFSLSFDFIDHRLVIESDRTRPIELDLPNRSVASFYGDLMMALSSLGIEVPIRPLPYGLPDDGASFPADTEHASYDADAVHRFWRILLRVDRLFEEFAGRFRGKSSPVHLFWHSFDLAVSRFSGRRAGVPSDANRVAREAYSEEVISFGFWPGDDNVREPAFYSYTAPEPSGLSAEPLRPAAARWQSTPTGVLALLRYEDARAAPDPAALIREFLQSAYLAGARRAGWDVAALAVEPPQTGWRPHRPKVVREPARTLAEAHRRDTGQRDLPA